MLCWPLSMLKLNPSPCVLSSIVNKPTLHSVICLCAAWDYKFKFIKQYFVFLSTIIHTQPPVFKENLAVWPNLILSCIFSQTPISISTFSFHPDQWQLHNFYLDSFILILFFSWSWDSNTIMLNYVIHLRYMVKIFLVDKQLNLQTYSMYDKY